MHRSTMALAGVLGFLTLLAILFLVGGTLSARVEAATAGAAEYPEAWAAVRDELSVGGAPQVFGEALPEDAAACRLEDVTLWLYNPGLISAEWVSVSVEGAPGDVAVYAVTGEGDTVPGRSTGSVNLKIVSRSDGSRERVYHVEYYVFGMRRRVSVREQ